MPLAPRSPRGVALLALAVAVRQRAGASLVRALEARSGPIEIWWGDRASIVPSAGLPGIVADLLLGGGVDREADEVATLIDGLGWVLDEPAEWPRLAALPDPPAFLCRKGRACGSGPVLAVVGARSATGYGLRMARDLASGVAAAGVTVVSGLARGVDAAAHLGALAAGGHTIAVLGSGPDRAYPPEHAALQDRIGREGTLLTEFLPGTPPHPGNFPRRNRVLVAVADAVLLVEARIKSGSLTSIRWAVDLGREVLVLPGPVDSALAEGPLQLLREGATPVGTVEHLLEALPGIVAAAAAGEASAPQAPRSAARSPTTPAEDRVLALVRGAPLDMDDLIRLSGEAPSRILTLVLALETRGLIAREAGGRSLRAVAM